MIVAAMAGIRVFATGGIGGVHRGAQETFDISADLQEFAQTPVARGLRRRQVHPRHRSDLGTWRLRACRSSATRPRAARLLHPGGGFKVDYRLDTPAAIAEALHLKWELGLAGGAVVANPIPTQFAMPKADMDAAIEQALREADEQGSRAGLPPLPAGRCAETDRWQLPGG